MKYGVQNWLLLAFAFIFVATGALFVSEYLKLRDARHDVAQVSDRIQAFETIIHSENWRHEFLEILDEGSSLEKELIENQIHIPKVPDEFIAERFLRYWSYNLKNLKVELPEESFTYESILPHGADVEDWKGELNEVFLLTETFIPKEIIQINFREEFRSDIWLRFCTLKLRVSYVELMRYLQKSGFSVWEYRYEKEPGAFYQLEITYCVRLQEVTE